MRRSVALFASAAAAIGSVPIATVVSSAHAADPAGTLSAVISQGARPECFTAQYQPTDGYRCPPAAMAVAVLPTGKVLFWDGLEGMNKVQYNVVAEFGDVAQNDQSRVADFTARSVSFGTPGNQSADANGTAGEDVDSPLPAGVVDSPGNDYDLFCSPLVQLADGTVLSAGGTKYYLEPGATDPTTGKSYGLSELQGLKATRIFDPAANTWKNLPGSSDMHYGRWYPTLVTLASGQVFVASGVTKLIKPAYTDGRSQFDSGRNVVETETFNPATRTWTVNHSSAPGSDPTLADGSQQSLPLFARLHLLPDGKVYYDAAGQTFNPDGQAYDEANWVHAKVYDPATQTWSDLPADTPTGLPLVDGQPLGFLGSGFDVMLPLEPDANGNYTTARVFNGGGVVGPTPGSYLGDDSTTINTIDTAGGQDTLTSESGPNLLNRRWYGSAVVLPDGQVFVTNGADRDEVDGPGSGSPVLQTELVNPDAGTVIAGPSLPSDHGRTYHNSAVLLPDGRVLIGGHAPIATGYAFQNDTAHSALGFSSAESDSTFQIYSPPYLSDGPRPVIDDIDHRATNGGRLEIETPQARHVTKVVLVRNPSMTHLTDGDQRTVEVPITSRDGDELTVRLPNASVLPTGPYMAFIETTSSSGHLVPSVSRQVMVVPDEDRYDVSLSMSASATVHRSPVPHHATAPAKPSQSVPVAVHAAPAASTSPLAPARREWPVVGAVLLLLGGVVVRRRLLRR
ncbi:MAG TPA: galactose oxidase early set domain-containing protein [Mycobacteriales bacterium]|nr:galactose oxidase early set domain-containing protein [Mycobacteriales bacterium]